MTDCWNTIGVRGDRSCPELFRHVDCRNCPVHAEGAREILCRHPLDEEADAPDAGAAPPIAACLDDLESLLVFRIGDEWLALPTRAVSEVIDRRPIHSVPHRSSGVVVGLANVRGELLTCVALDRLLNVNRRTPAAPAGASRNRLLVVRRDNVRAVCETDEVDGIHRVHADAILPTSPTADAGGTGARGVTSLGHRPVAVIDDGRLFEAIVRGLA